MKAFPWHFLRRDKKGQILIIFALVLPIVILMTGLTVDVGLMYRADARISRALDSTALRIGENPKMSLDRRKAVALTTLKANYPDFLSGKTVNDWTVNGTINATGGEQMYISNNVGEWARVTTVGSGNTTYDYKPVDVIFTTVEAQVRQPTYFMRIIGSNYVEMKRKAVAKRFPAVIALVLDISGSMLEQGNSGNFPTSGTRADGLLDAVEAFCPFFDDTRDFMLVVAYSRNAAVVWPPNEDDDGETSDGYFFPARGFNTGIGGVSSKNVSNWLNSNLKWYGSTNAYEGMRIAAKNVKAMLDTYPQAIRDQIQVNYVLMTDGQFNTLSSYARGPGFGYPWNDANGTATDPSARPTWLPAKYDFHLDPLLVGNMTSATDVPIPAFDSSATSGFTSYNLATRAAPTALFGTVGNATLARGVRGIIDDPINTFTDNSTVVWKASFASHSGSTTSGSPPSTYLADLTAAYPGSSLSDSVYPRGRGVNANGINNNGGTSNANLVLYPVSFSIPSSSSKWKDWSYPANFFFKNGTTNPALNNSPYWNLADATALSTNATRYRMVYEKAKLFNINLVGFPGAVIADAMNPFKNTSSPRYSWDGTKNRHDPDGVMTNDYVGFFPGTRRYANSYGVFFRDTYSGYSSSSNPVNWVKASVSSSTLPPRDLYGIGTMAISDFYPNFTCAGGLDQFTNPVGTNSSENATYSAITDLTQLGSWTTNATAVPPRYNWSPVRDEIDDTNNRMNWKDWWSVRNNQWETSNPDNTNGYWLVEAQCWLLREQQKATIYTVDYSGTYADAMKRMANDNNDATFPQYSNQRNGNYYDVTAGNTALVASFQEIAKRISLKLVQ
ncbi:MAG: pilus assembly protein [Candidatus Methylacidiphilales bacterium]|nr:pilus assembly protein [Candidatus Methylacidiphilales bacterium]